MRILHVTMGIDPKSGGPTRSVKGLCRELDKAGIDVTLLVLHGNDKFENSRLIKVVYGKQIDLEPFELVHLHGIWDWHLHEIAVACRKTGLPYLYSPRGMLDPWALGVKKWKKRLALALYQKRDLKGASMFHATAKDEASHIRQQGLRQPIIIAPNGVDLPLSMPDAHKYAKGGQKTAMFLSRLHPGKGLITLAKAWAKVRPLGWRILVIGPDDYGHKRDVLAELERLGIGTDWEFVGMVSDQEKWEYYCSSDLLVHPSVSENFGITIAEGLAAGLPVICTKGTPWSVVARRECGWWIDVGVEPLARALSEATELPASVLRGMGDRGRTLANEIFTWGAVVKKMISGYWEVLDGKS